jgi:hypothetical protein
MVLPSPEFLKICKIFFSGEFDEFFMSMIFSDSHFNNDIKSMNFI